MRKNMKAILSIILVLTILFDVVVFAKKTFSKKADLININQLSEEFMDSYFEEVSNVSEEQKDNMLIITSIDDLHDTYGASNVIEAPNHQYFLVYDSEDKKNEALEKFDDDSNIDVSENIIYRAYDDTVLVSSYNSWGVEAMGMDTLLEKLENKELNDVVVAIIDTGLDVELFNKYYPGRLMGMYNVLENNDNMYDDDGHGTHVAGTIAESTPSSVKILPVKISVTASMRLVDIITGINYVSYNRNADVMNMSLGGEEYSLQMYNTIQAAKENNIISVAAAGNANKSVPSYPAAYTNTISVAAVDINKEKAAFSNYGSSILFAAPGVGIKSTMQEGVAECYYNGQYLCDGEPDFDFLNGTSMASPHVAASVANLKSINKNLSFDDTIVILRRYSIDLGDSGWDEIFGYGFIDFSNADVCDGQNCDEYNVFKSRGMDDSIGIFDSYEVEPMLSAYNYGNINNIMGTKVKVNYTDNSFIEYQLSDIFDLNISEYDPTSKSKQTINISFITPLGVEVNSSFDVTNPQTYESIWEYELVGDNTIEITGFKDSNIVIVGSKFYFPSIIDGYTVTGIADSETSIFSGILWDIFKNVKYIYLPSTITKIGNNAFCNRTIVAGDVSFLPGELNIVESDADSLTIGDNAFRAQNYLNELDATVSYLGDYSLSGASSLQSITFSDDITHIGNGALSGAMTGQTITIPSTVMEIGEEVFAGNSVSSVIFMNDMETIPNGMFRDNESLERFFLPGGVTTIGDNAFKGCNNLREIRLNHDLTTIGNNAFEGAFKVDEDVEVYVFESVTSIGIDAFKNIASNAKLYVYSNSYAKTYANTNNVNYVQVDPDSIVVHGINSQYNAFDSINVDDVTMELIYNEKTTRTEVLNQDIYIEYPDSREQFRYGDTSVIVSGYNSVDYPIEKIVQVEILKAIPDYTIPTGLTADPGQTLSQIELPVGFEWMNEEQVVNISGKYKARYVPSDTDNYETVENIDILVRLSNEPFVVNDYTVDVINDIFSGVGPSTELNSFTSNIFLGDGYSIEVETKDVNGKNVVYTGAKVRITHGTELYKEFTISVIGDLNGDGDISVSDCSMIYKYLGQKSEFNDAQVIAANVNGEGGITVSDASIIYKHLNGKINLGTSS